MKKTLFSEIDRVLAKLVKMRRDIHAHPELAFEEVRTAEVASRYLKTLGLEVSRGLATTGVVGLLRGSLPGRTLAIRAELDAVAIQERSNFPHASKKAGIMHACGHDGHLAVSLGTAKILSLLKDRLRGNVKFILQPADEGRGGAKAMLQAGVLLDSPRIEAILGIHSSPEISLGKVALMDGGAALTDSFQIQIQGRGGHPAFPQTVIDPIFLSAQVINGLQSLAGRFAGAAVTLSAIQGGSAPNVIPDSVQIRGTIRIETAAQREALRSAVESLAAGVCGAYGGRCQVEYEAGTPMPRQDAAFAGHIVKGAESLWGPDHIQNLGHPAPGTEELSPFLEKVPGAICLLGTTPAGAESVPLHSPYFDFNDQALAPGIQIAVATAFSYLNGGLPSLR